MFNPNGNYLQLDIEKSSSDYFSYVKQCQTDKSFKDNSLVFIYKSDRSNTNDLESSYPAQSKRVNASNKFNNLTDI